MSYHLGIARHLPALHRQLTSPSSHEIPKSPPEEGLTEDSKDVLIERLNDLVLRLSNSHSIDDAAITDIHSQVDKMELIVQKEERQQSPGSDDINRSLNIPKEEDGFWGPPSPSSNLRMRLPPKSIPSAPNQSEALMSPAKAAKLAKDAQELASLLATTVAELQTRREESDHIHDLLVTRAEKAAERILCLEYRISEMEDDFQANQSELKYLRIQLQAIEAQCSQYIPLHEDPVLAESIKNWRVDWEDIDRKSKARRKKCHVSLIHNHSIPSETPTLSSIASVTTP